MNDTRQDLVNALSALSMRAEWTGRTREHDDLVQGGSDAMLEYVESHTDVTRPIAYYYADVHAVYDRLIAQHQAELAELRDRIPAEGALW